MLKRTVTLTCKKCGRQFTYTCTDAVMPKDAQMMKKPVCRKCRVKHRISCRK